MQQELCRHTHTGIQGRQPLALGSRATARKRGQYRGQRLHRDENSGNGSGLTLSEGVTNREMSGRKSVDMQSGQGCLMGWIRKITEDCNGRLSAGLSG